MNRSCCFWMLLLLLNLLVSCHEKPATPVNVDSPQLKESLEKANRYLVNEEEEEILNYISRHKLDMTSTGTGLRYQVVKAGTGAQIQPGQRVTMEYVLFNIMGGLHQHLQLPRNYQQDA